MTLPRILAQPKRYLAWLLATVGCWLAFPWSVQAQITFRNAAQAVSAAGGTIAYGGAGAFVQRTNVGSITPAFPAGTAVGDLLITQVIAREDAATVTMPNWNLLFTDTPVNDYQVKIYWRVFTGTAGDTSTITQTGSGNLLAARMTRYTGADPVAPILNAGTVGSPVQLPATNWSMQNTAQVVTGTETTVAPAAMLVIAAFNTDDSLPAAPPGACGSLPAFTTLTQAYANSTTGGRDGAIWQYYGLQTTAGTKGPYCQGQTNGNDRNHGVLIALNPIPATALTINVPAGTVQNDVMIASIAVRPCSAINGGACTVSISPPAGWSLLRQVNQTTGGAFGNVLAIYSKVASSIEPGSYTWSFGGTPVHTGAVGAISSYAGVDDVSLIVAENGQATASAATHATPGISTGTVANTMLVATHTSNASGTWTPAGGMTEVIDVASLAPNNNAGISMEVSYEPFAPAGATGVRTATRSSPPANNTGTTHLLALRPLQPLAFYRLDEVSWNGTAGEVVDSSGNGLHGTALGGTLPVPAKVCNGAQLNASTGVLDRVIEIPHNNLFNTTTAVTVTAWINPTAWPGSDLMSIASKDTTWEFHINTTGQIFWWWNTGGAALTTAVPGGAAPLNTWTHVAITFAQGQQRIYVNGVMQASGTDGAALFTNTVPLQIGGDQNFAGGARRFRGMIDEVKIYDRTLSQSQVVDVMNETRPCPVALDHIRIEHTGTGLTCEPASVTVKACANAACSSLYVAGSVTTTLSPTGWVGGDTISFTGSTIAQLRRTTAGAVALGAGTTAPAPANVTRCFNGLTETCNLDFRDTGFLFGAIPAQTAATVSATHTLQAVRTDNATGACTGLFTGNVPNIELASECVNPGTCQPGQQVTFSNNGSSTIAANNGGSVSTWTPRTLTFGANSTASFSFSYPDVGSLRLHARYNINSSGNYVSGVSTGFVVRPAGFTVTNVRRAADNAPNPAAADAGGAVFIRAGENIALTATAVNSLGVATPNYGRETPAEGVRLTAALAPGLGLTSNPALGNGTIPGAAFSAGAAAVTNVSWGEVGIIRITPGVGDSDYLGAGDVTGIATGNIGRFTPHHFDVSANAPLFATACAAGGFTYVGQPFVYGLAPVLTVTARNLAGGTTQNYKVTTPAAQAFFKISNASLTGKAYTAASGSVDAGGVTAPDPAVVANGNGTGTLTFNAGSGLLFDRSTQAAPFDAEISLAINVVDADGVAYTANPARFGQASAGNGVAFSAGKTMRYGRLRLGGASGSQLLPLRVPVEAQYWNGSSWITNTADACTTLLAGNIGLGNYIGNLNAGETTVSITASPLQAGRTVMRLSAPGAGNNGSVDVAVNLGATASADACPALTPPAAAGNKTYLRGKWCGATATRDPAARARFGILRSSDEAIYNRENY